MRHRKKHNKLGMQKDHRDLMLRNMATSIILYEKIKTTQSKAKAVSPLVEKLITIARTKEAQIAIREINTYVLDKNASRKLMKELKDRYKTRNSGFTRINRIGFRMSDAAPMVQLELV